MNLLNVSQLFSGNSGQQSSGIRMSPEVEDVIVNPLVQDPMVHAIRCLVTTPEFTSIKKTKFAYSLEGYKKDTKVANKKAMKIFLLASQYYKLGNLYFAAHTYRRNAFSSNNL